MPYILSVVLAALLTTAFAVPTEAPHHSHVLHESRTGHAHTSFIKRSAAPSGNKIPVRIGMSQQNLHNAENLLNEIADPASPHFGQHYTAEEVHDLFAPSEATVAAVRQWLLDSGIEDFSQSFNKQWMQFDASVETLEKLVKAKYHEFVHSGTGAVHVACDEYSVPQNMQEHIDYITPGVVLMSTNGNLKRSQRAADFAGKFNLPPVMKGKLNADLAAKVKVGAVDTCSEVITPECVFALYNFTQATSAVYGNELGIFEDLAQYYAASDLDNYFAGFSPWVPKGTRPTLQGIDGGGRAVPAPEYYAGIEADLDFEAAIPLIWPQKTVLYQTDDPYYESSYNYDGFLNNFFDGIDGSYCHYSAFNLTGNSDIDPPYPDAYGFNHSLQCGAHKPTNVISISYGGAEAGLPMNYQQRQCNEILKLGLQGVTVVVSSGDYGVSFQEECIDGTVFVPAFPATCPYVVSVGATYLPPGASTVADAEVATVAFASGGGFSNIYPIPSYQANAVATYFKKHPPPYEYYNITYEGGDYEYSGGQYNRGGRGYPDVAAVGYNFVAVIKGVSYVTGGTSLSAPVFASILTRINDARLHAGKKTLGFVNPSLYANPRIFHDITVGSNPGCGYDGFSCAKGWDPVTGLGTPKFGAMMDYLFALP